MTSFARRERLALCDTALRAGPDAPTLCDPWDVKALVCHLLVRERNPVAAAGIAVPPLSGLTEHAMERARADRLRRARRAVPVAVGGAVRASRAWSRCGTPWSSSSTTRTSAGRSPGGHPVAAGRPTSRPLWSYLKVTGRGLARPAGVPVRMEWAAQTATLRGGDDPVVLRGAPSEIALVLQGRARVADVKYDGPAAAVARLRGADLGV